MAVILFNPDNGATIQDVTPPGGVTYFSDGDVFEPGSVFKFEDERVGEFFKNTFEFLQEVSPDTAKKLIGEPKLKCEQCSFETRIKTQLVKHQETHKKDKELDDMGIPIIQKRNTTRKQLDAPDSPLSGQKAIEESENSRMNDGYPGLEEGEGLTQERVPGKRKEAIMS